MQHNFKRFGNVKRKWGAKVRYGLVSALFLAGIISVLGSLSAPSTTEPEHASDSQLKEVKQDIAELKEKVRTNEQLISETDDPDSRQVHADMITDYKAKIDYLETYIEDAKNARSAGSCFTADMWVLTEDGAKTIGQIKVGDRVLSVDADGQQVPADVLKTLADRNHHYYLINGSIRVTGLHRFFTDAGWKKAKELAKGDRIQTTEGIFAEIATIEWMPSKNLDVYNLTIAENHNFFISPDGKNGYLVHNTGGGGGGGGSK